MPGEYSFIHRQQNYWRVRFDDANGWEAPHIHASQGERELQVYTQTLDIKNQTGRFSTDEIKEIKSIAEKYLSAEARLKKYNKDELTQLKQKLLNYKGSKRK